MPADVVYGNLSLTFSQPVECLLTVLLAKRLLAIIAPLDETLPLVNSSMLTHSLPVFFAIFANNRFEIRMETRRETWRLKKAGLRVSMCLTKTDKGRHGMLAARTKKRLCLATTLLSCNDTFHVLDKGLQGMLCR